MEASKDSTPKGQVLSGILDRGLTIAVVFCVAVCAAAWARLVYDGAWPGPSQGALASGADYAVGDSVQKVQELDGVRSGTMVLLFLNSNCSICEAHPEVYRSLAEHLHQATPGVPIVAASRESLSAFGKYLSAHAIKPDQTVYIHDDSAFTPTKVPNVYVVDRFKKIVKVWTGELSPKDIDDIVRQAGA